MVRILENYLIEAVFWTLEDIFLFTRMLPYLSLKSRVPFYYKLLNTLDRYRHFERGRSILQTALASIIDDFIEKNEIEHMELMIRSLKRLVMIVRVLILKFSACIIMELLSGEKAQKSSRR